MIRTRKRRDPGTEQGDPLIPILNVVCLLIPLMLYGAVFVRFTTLTVKPPAARPDGKRQDPAQDLNLTVMATDRGFHIKVNPQFRKSWMAAATMSDGPDIPRLDDGLDFAALEKRLRELKEDHRAETRIILGLEDDLPFDVLIKMMDRSRGTEDSPLFPEVTLTRGVV